MAFDLLLQRSDYGLFAYFFVNTINVYLTIYLYSNLCMLHNPHRQ